MSEKMKKILRQMSLRMGLTMSFFLSLVGTFMSYLNSGRFSIATFLMNYAVSTIVSLIIGYVIPVGKVSGDVSKSFNLRRGTLKARLIESLVSDLIYTPIVTFIMVTLAYEVAMKQSGGKAQLNFGRMFFPSLIICFVVGYILIFFFMPFYLKGLLKKYGMEEGYGPVKKD